ncbi:MAG TPA: hypothetical protein VKX46_05775 [Ktedonobacteraceae bacterium]|jgi:hypothetical protein|nr:hypothetical protein [Ktedonobacteraceae bacterium]
MELYTLGYAASGSRQERERRYVIDELSRCSCDNGRREREYNE